MYITGVCIYNYVTNPLPSLPSSSYVYPTLLSLKVMTIFSMTVTTCIHMYSLTYKYNLHSPYHVIVVGMFSGLVSGIG